jgi:type IV secretion system protein VirB10
MPASDTSGYAGLADMIDRHSFQILKGVALSTLLGLGTELSLGRDDGDIVSALRRSAQQSGARAGDQFVGRSLDIQPTIRVRPGWPLRIVVNKDIVLRPWPSGGA